MVPGLAPRALRGAARPLILLAGPLALLLMSGPSAFGQGDPAKAAAATKKAEDDKDKDKDLATDQDEKSVLDRKSMRKVEATEVYRDPKVEALLPPNKFKETLYPNPRFNDRDLTLLKGMAGNLSPPDRALLGRFVDTKVADLTSHTNIRMVLDPPANLPVNAAAPRAIEAASRDMMDLLLAAKANNNAAFLKLYAELLTAKLPPLLDNHLLPRFEAALILGTLASPSLIDLYVKEVTDPDQVAQVKLWGARGLTMATNGGKVVLDIAKSRAAVGALLGLIEDGEGFWPVKVRAFEALGSLRQTNAEGPRGAPRVPAIAMAVVSDPSARIELRAWAAWSIGMVPIPADVAKFNFAVEGFQIGSLAADLGDRIFAEYRRLVEQKKGSPKGVKGDVGLSRDNARYLTGLLLYQVYPAIGGNEDNPGLLVERNPSIAPVKTFLTGLDGQMKGLSKASLEFLNAAPIEVDAKGEPAGDFAAKGQAVGEATRSLRAFLEANKPASFELYPGGPQFAPAALRSSEPPKAPATPTAARPKAPPAGVK